MRSRWFLVLVVSVCVLPGCLAVIFYTQRRIDRCAYVPLLAENILPNTALLPGAQAGMPAGWSRAAGGVELRGPAIDGEGFVLEDGRALQLIGIANYVQTPSVPVQPGRSYCFTGMALTDSDKGAPTRLRLSFHWYDAQAHLLAEDHSDWQPVVLWQPDAPPAGWSRIHAAFRAPTGAASLLVRIHPAADDRVYLDAMRLRQAGNPLDRSSMTGQSEAQPEVTLAPWPHGYRAALSFSFDWETAMGGLIHSRSVGDPYADEDPELRGMRMREGITTTLNIFRPYGIRATYYATGYNFLMGNTARREFMGNPTYAWANRQNHWSADHWQKMPWFAFDPYGTVQSHPAWYFGDLISILQREQQDIQSHTFSHFYGGFVTPQDWRDDIAAWNEVAAAQGVPPMRSLAFPWSSSGGMSDANWQVLQEAGIRSVTRMSHQSQYNLFPRDADGLVVTPRCRPLPGHPHILACPDFYLTPQSAERALAQIDRTLEIGGTIDLWAHTEEVITDEQQAAWQRVVAHAAAQPGLWIAPLRDITDWQYALSQVKIRVTREEIDGRLVMMMRNNNEDTIEGVTLQLPFHVAHATVQTADTATPQPVPCADAMCSLTIPPGQAIEVHAWPAV